MYCEKGCGRPAHTRVPRSCLLVRRRSSKAALLVPEVRAGSFRLRRGDGPLGSTSRTDVGEHMQALDGGREDGATSPRLAPGSSDRGVARQLHVRGRERGPHKDYWAGRPDAEARWMPRAAAMSLACTCRLPEVEAATDVEVQGGPGEIVYGGKSLIDNGTRPRVEHGEAPPGGPRLPMPKLASLGTRDRTGWRRRRRGLVPGRRGGGARRRQARRAVRQRRRQRHQRHQIFLSSPAA